LSAWHLAGAANRIQPAAQQWPLVSLEPQSRAWLHARITQRLDAMLAAGFMAEVQALRQRADLHANLPAMRCVGYRQALAALERGQRDGWAHEAGDDLRQSAIAATRQLAKRQLTWLRRMTNKTAVECDTEGALARALLALKQAAMGR
jgi:tRNA dimethylallyltransferase